MDQQSLSLKSFKKKQSKTKENTLFLKQRRNYKKQTKFGMEKNLRKLFKKDFPNPSKKTFYVNRKKGQVLIESLFVIICLLSFLLAIQFFQSFGRKEIQKHRLKKQIIYKIKKAPWHRIENI